jgi:hypothetical protein
LVWGGGVSGTKITPKPIYLLVIMDRKNNLNDFITVITGYIGGDTTRSVEDRGWN